MPGFFQALAEWLGFDPAPGTPEHREALFRAVKAKNDEQAKPAGQRDEAKLLELRKRLLRLSIQNAQAQQQWCRYNAGLLQHLDLGCCRDGPRVNQRHAATLQAMAAWHEQWEQVYRMYLEALEQGHPYPPLKLPYLEVQPFLPEGLPEDLPPTIDRCAACHSRLEQCLFLEQDLQAGLDPEP